MSTDVSFKVGVVIGQMVFHAITKEPCIVTGFLFDGRTVVYRCSYEPGFEEWHYIYELTDEAP